MATSQDALIKKLIENNIHLQKKTTELLVGMHSLTTKVSSLVSIFEDAAKKINPEGDELKPLIEKINELTEQNKTLAKGLILLENYIKEKQPARSFKPGSLQEF